MVDWLESFEKQVKKSKKKTPKKIEDIWKTTTKEKEEVKKKKNAILNYLAKGVADFTPLGGVPESTTPLYQKLLNVMPWGLEKYKELHAQVPKVLLNALNIIPSTLAATSLKSQQLAQERPKSEEEKALIAQQIEARRTGDKKKLAELIIAQEQLQKQTPPPASDLLKILEAAGVNLKNIFTAKQPVYWEQALKYGLTHPDVGVRTPEAQKKAIEIGAPIAGLAIDILTDPLTYLTFGGMTGLKVGGKVATRAGARAFSDIVKEGLSKGLAQEAAEASAKLAMKGILEAGGEKAAKYFGEGGIRLSEWLGGETLIPGSKLAPLWKALGISQVYEGVKTWQFSKFINKALRPRAGVPEDLFIAKENAIGKRLYELANAKGKFVDIVHDTLGRFSKAEQKQITHALEDSKIFTQSPEKLQKASILVRDRLEELWDSLAERGVAVGKIENYVPIIAKDIFQKEEIDAVERLLKEAIEKTVTVAGVTRKKEALEFPRLVFKSIADAKAKGAKVEENIFKILENYEGQVARIHAFMDTVDAAKYFGYAAKEGEQIPEGFIKGSGLLENYHFSPDVLSFITETQKAYFSDTALKWVVQQNNRVLRWWKGMAILSPGFYGRNLGGDLYFSYLLGNKNPTTYFRSIKTVISKLVPTVARESKSVAIAPSGEKLSINVLFEELTKRKALGHGMFGSEVYFGSAYEKLAPMWGRVLKKLNPFSIQGAPSWVGRQIGLLGENIPRLADGIYMFEKTGSLDAAAEAVKKFHFDYTELTRFEQNIAKPFINPFWTFFKKNTALSFEQMAKQPAKFGFFGKMRNMLETYWGEQNEDYMSEWMKQQYPYPTPFKGETGQIYLRPDLPYKALWESTDPTILASSVNPIIKLLAEMGFQKEIFTGQDIVKYPGYRAPAPGYLAVLPEPLKQFFGVKEKVDEDTGEKKYTINPYLAYFLKQNPLLARIGKAIPTDISSKTSMEKWSLNIMSMMVGLGMSAYSEEREKKYAEKRYKQLKKAMGQ